MNENEIIDYLKGNFTRGVAFRFMPNEVQRWCIKHRDENIFFMFTNDYGWGSKQIKICCLNSSVYALDYDYEIKPEFVPHWEEFEIDESGHFYYDNIEFHYRDDAIFEKRYQLIFKGFGGWLFKDRIWCTNPQVTVPIDIGEGEEDSVSDFVSKDDICEPLIPSKIRFWRYKE